MRNWNSLTSYSLNSLWPGLFWCIRDPGGGGTLCPPLNIFGLGGVRVPILVVNGLPTHDLPCCILHIALHYIALHIAYCPFPNSLLRKVKFFLCACMHICLDIRKYATGGAHCAPPGPNRVKLSRNPDIWLRFRS